jgi:hypothetical protein
MRIGGENRATATATAATTAAAAETTRPATGDAPDGPSPFARILRGLGREVDHGEKVVRRAIEGGGKDLGPGELLALQAGVYRYSEAVDLSAKLVDRATSGVKTVLQGQ